MPCSDLLDEACRDGRIERDPAPVYRALHASGDRHCRSGFWSAPVFFKHADVSAILRDPGTFSNCGRVVNHLKVRFPEAAAGELKPLADHYSRGLINSDPPEHTRLRKLIQPAFFPRTLNRLRDQVDGICVELLDRAEKKGEIDWVADFAFLLPVTMIAELLGVPKDMRTQFKDWSVRTVEFMATPTPTLDAMRRSQAALLELRSYFASICKERQADPGEDLISLLVQSEVDGDRLSEDDLLGTCVTLLIGGHETTTSLLTSAVYLLGKDRELRERLVREPESMPKAVEEFLRVEPPFHRILRVPVRDTEVAGQKVSAGETIVLLLGAANRDPDQFPDPDKIMVERSPNRHLAFGYGIHHCLGAGLARIEAPTALNHLLRRFPNFVPLSEEPEWHDGMVRSIKQWNIRVNP